LNVFVRVEYTTLSHALSGRRLSMEREKFEEEDQNPVRNSNFPPLQMRSMAKMCIFPDENRKKLTGKL
ncbi:hypothetical protein K1X24_09985, partial [Campylobacter jejuni]|uniref:hypothetical protein n=1 Tax=Campylobacter jejuni TaxID=197 RepID=UPI003B7E478F